VCSSDLKRESLELMRKIVEAALKRDATTTAERCRAFVERSAKFAIVVLNRQETAERWSRPFRCGGGCSLVALPALIESIEPYPACRRSGLTGIRRGPSVQSSAARTRFFG